MTDECLLPMFDVTARRISPHLSQKSEQCMAKLANRSLSSLYFQHLYFARLLLPATSRTAQKAASAQTAVDCALLACALERYRREHGQFPESLAALEPRFFEKLPHDIINGEPLKYHRPETGQYILYSVGWNEVDDGGAVGVAKPGEENSIAQGDWVWR